MQGILMQIASCEAQLEDLGLSNKVLWEKAAGNLDPDAPPGASNKRARKCFQKTVRKAIVSRLGVNSEARMCFKLDRWHLSGLPGVTARRFLRALFVVKGHMPPRVGAAVLRTAWNGWCSSRRFQRSGHCLF